MSEPLAIETAGLRKTYGGVEALRGLDLQVPAGSIHGFLGRNGAGKTTTIKIVLGMTRPTGGNTRVFGLPADQRQSSLAIRSRAGFVSEEKDLYPYMTVEETIRFTAAFYPGWRRDLDEPTAGLDPAVTEEVLQCLVAHVGSEEMTVFFSSHQIAEVEQIADRVTIIDRGRTSVSGALEDFRENYRRIQLVFGEEAPSAEKAPAFRGPGVLRVDRRSRALTLIASGGAEQIVEEARALNAISVDITPVTLKEIFLETVRGEG